MDTELSVDDGEWIVAHFAGARRVVQGLRFGADERFDLGVGAGASAGVEFFAAVGCEGVRIADGAAEFHAFYENAQIFGRTKVVCANSRRGERIVGTKDDFAAALRGDQNGAEAEAVFGMRGETVIAVVDGAEEDLEVRNRQIGTSAMEEASFGDVRSKRAAMRDDVAEEILEGGGIAQADGLGADKTDGNHGMVLKIFADAGKVVKRSDAEAL